MAESISKVKKEGNGAKWRVPKGRAVRVYVDGIYDVFHFGHARSLEQAKKLFPKTYLLVGVINDEITRKMKGISVMTEKERYESVKHCKWTDEVIEDAPWVVDQQFLDQHQIDFVAHGEDPCYDSEGNDVYAFVKGAGRYRYVKRTEGISTSDLIMRIVRNYDAYVRRNLKKGYSFDDMNVGLMKRSQIQLENKAHKIQEQAAKQIEIAKEEIEELTEELKEGVVHIKEMVQEETEEMKGGIQHLKENVEEELKEIRGGMFHLKENVQEFLLRTHDEGTAKQNYSKVNSEGGANS